MESNDRKIIFVIGRGRSGTTLLNKVLSAHPQIGFICNEYDYFFWFWKNHHLYDYFGGEKYWRMALDFLKSPEMQDAENCLRKEDFLIIDNFHDWLYALLAAYCPGKEYVGVKVSDLILENCEMIKAEFKEAYCLHIIRDPRDVYLSVKKMPIKDNPFYCTKYWKEVIDGVSLLSKTTAGYWEVRYEQLIKFPEQEIRAICDNLGVPFADQMLRFNKYISSSDRLPDHPLLRQSFVADNCNKWRAELSSEELFLIYAACQDKMLELGYLDASQNCQLSFFRHVWEYLSSKISHYMQLVRRRRLIHFRRRGVKAAIIARAALKLKNDGKLWNQN